MTRRRTDIGLHIIAGGKDISNLVLPWGEFLERVQKAAQKPKSKNRGRALEAPQGAPPWLNEVTPERRCRFVNSKTGKQCRRWAMRGARRCASHGGYRENPEHPATVRRLASVIERDLALKSGTALKEMPAGAIAAAETYLREQGLPTRAVSVLAGAQAYTTEDNGRAWRRWQKHIRAAAPSQGVLARRGQTGLHPK